jgi:hypothetical protein
LLLAVLTSESDPGPGGKPGSAQTVQPPPKFPQTLAAVKFLLSNYMYSAIAVLATYLPDAGQQKKPNFSALIVGLAWHQTRATYVARSGANRSAIYYDFLTRLYMSSIKTVNCLSLSGVVNYDLPFFLC